jgi:peptidoglycan-associated lipoprotein
MVRKNLVKFLVVLIAIWIVGGCAKKIMPPEVDATGGATGSESSGAGGISEGGAGTGGSDFGSGAGAGAGAGAGTGGSDFGSGAGAGAGAGNGAGGAGQEARSLDFQPTTDLGDVFFAFDKYDLDDNSKKALQKNADWLKQHPGTKTQIEGHCDERGTNNYNLALGERRALSTKKYLVALGVEDSRIYTISYGEEKPFCMEHKESCWQQNRRGHFLISK